MKQWIMRLVLLALVSGVIFGMCEFAARKRFGPSQDILRTNVILQHDPVVGMKGIPGFEGRVRPNYIHVSINRHGFRDEDWDTKLERARTSGARRILTLGDSMLFGYRIEAEHRLTEQLDWFYDTHGLEAEVFNTGIPAYGTAQEMRVLETYFPEIEPDVVILRYCANDFGDDAFPFDFRYEHRVYRPFYDLEGNLVLHERVPKRPSLHFDDAGLGFLQSKYIVDQIAYALEDLRFARYVALPPDWSYRHLVRNLRTMRSFNRLNTDPRLVQVYELNKHRNFALWRQMKEYCEERGARFIVLAWIPDGETMTPEDRELVEFFHEAGIEFVNQYAETAPLSPWCIVWGDGHPNFLDNFVAARMLFERLESAPARTPIRQAPWYYQVPPGIDFGGPPVPEMMTGDWGQRADSRRALGRRSGVLLRSLQAGPSTLLVSGIVRPPTDDAPPGAETSLVLLQSWSPVDRAALPPEGPFTVSFEVPANDDGLLYLEFDVEGQHQVEIAQIGPPGLCRFVHGEHFVVNLGTPPDRYCLRGGFHDRERAYNDRMFRWTDAEAVIEICLAPAPGDYVLRIEQIDAERPASAPPASLTARLNDLEIEMRPATSRHDHVTALEGVVPASLIRLGENRLVLESATWVPAEHTASVDGRRLGTMLDVVLLQPLHLEMRR